MSNSEAKSSGEARQHSKFPTMNPHEKPFQNVSSSSESTKKSKPFDSGLKTDAEANPFENLILKMKQSQLNQIMEINKQEQDLKKKKVHLSNEYEHFNSLLNKIMPSITNTIPPTMPSSASTSFLSQNQLNDKKNEKNMSASASSHNILKWFDNSIKN